MGAGFQPVSKVSTAFASFKEWLLSKRSSPLTKVEQNKRDIEMFKDRVESFTSSLRVTDANIRHLEREKEVMQNKLDQMILSNRNLPESKAFLRGKLHLLHILNSQDIRMEDYCARRFQFVQARDQAQHRVDLLNQHLMVASSQDEYFHTVNMDSVAETFAQLDVQTRDMQRDHTKIAPAQDHVADVPTQNLLETQLRKYENDLLTANSQLSTERLYDVTPEPLTTTDYTLNQTREGEIAIHQIRQLVYS